MNHSAQFLNPFPSAMDRKGLFVGEWSYTGMHAVSIKLNPTQRLTLRFVTVP